MPRKPSMSGRKWPPEGLVGTDHLAPREQLEGALFGHQPGDHHRGQGREHPHLDLGLADLEPIVGDDHVAEDRKFAAAPQGRAIDTNHYRYAQSFQPREGLLGLQDTLEHALAFRFIRVQIHFQHLGNIPAGEELTGFAAANIHPADGVLLGFQFIQDPLNYMTQLHHTHLDGYDHLQKDDMKQAAVIVAACGAASSGVVVGVGVSGEGPWHAATRIATPIVASTPPSNASGMIGS